MQGKVITQEFEVNQLSIAKKMMELGCKCIGCRVNLYGYMVWQFERTDKTREYYLEAREHFLKAK